MGKFEMAKAAHRILQFREDHVNGKISTSHTTEEDGMVVFKAYIWKDKKEFLEVLKSGVGKTEALLSADADASAKGELEDKKDFEKLETIAVGRALAYIGYLQDGQVASTEEMEEFHKHKEDKIANEVETAVELILNTVSLDELKNVWIALPNTAKTVKEVVDIKDHHKKLLTEAK
jgi:hypothetical protein